MTNKNADLIVRPSSKYAIRFDALHPGSLFRIERERSRGMYKSDDFRVYRKARDGFYAEEEATGRGCCLMPQDLVMPVVIVSKNRR